jgi:phosphoserine phosphatase
MNPKSLYLLHDGDLQTINQVPPGSIKLSVFKPTDRAKRETMQEWQELIHSFQLGDPLYVKLRGSNRLSVLDIFVEPNELNRLLENYIKPNQYDFIVWPTQLNKPELIVFDMDSTFIEIEVIDELARRHGVGESVAKVTEAAMQGQLDFSESLISRVACLEGLSAQAIESVCQSLPLSKGVEPLVESCHNNQIKIAIVSGGFTPFVSYLKNQMNLYRVKANNLDLQKGRLTGKLEGAIVDAKAKANFVKELASELGLGRDQVMAIGDGANDLEMMKESGFSLAYRAKPAVQAQAKGRMNHTQLDDLIAVFDW